jgi:predicted RNA binding protein YcfA (HicA-like mRNA interferase family)
MPKLPNLTSKELIKKLKQFGFELDHTTGSHYVFFNHETGRRAVVPYHTKNLPKGTFLAILRAAGLSKDDITQKS